MRAIGGRRTLALTCAALGVVVCSGCDSQPPDLDRIAHAIASSDSLRHRPLQERKLVGAEDLPVASNTDSDSVTWLNINQKPVYPKGHWQRID